MGWRDYPQHFAERVRWEMSRYRDVVINTGISGNRMPGLLKDVDWRVHRFQPQVVSLMMGMNDCAAGASGRDQYRNKPRNPFAPVQARGSILLLHTPNLIYFPNDARRKDLPAYVDILRDFATPPKCRSSITTAIGRRPARTRTNCSICSVMARFIRISTATPNLRSICFAASIFWIRPAGRAASSCLDLCPSKGERIHLCLVELKPQADRAGRSSGRAAIVGPANACAQAHRLGTEVTAQPRNGLPAASKISTRIDPDPWVAAFNSSMSPVNVRGTVLRWASGPAPSAETNRSSFQVARPMLLV